MFQLNSHFDKSTAIQTTTAWIENQGFTIQHLNSTKPWGAYYLINDADQDKFITSYFSDSNITTQTSLTLSLKFLLVAPNSRLSWQYHHYRQEYWYVINGPVGITLSQTDTQLSPQIFHANSHIQIPQGTRHRLNGTQNWGLVAEIWQHTDINHPSTEFDIIRLQDDYNRKD